MPGLQQFGGLGQHAGILDAVPPPGLARRHEVAFAALDQARLGARHRAGVESEGLRQRGVRGEAKQGAASETQIAPDFVVDGMRGDRLGEQKVDEVLAIAQQVQARAEGKRFALLELPGRRWGVSCGVVSPAITGQSILKDTRASQAHNCERKTP